MSARGGAFSNTNTNTSVNTGFLVLASTATTDGANEDFQHNGNGELEYTGVATKAFEGVIFVTGDRTSGTAIANFTLTGGLDTGGGYAPIDAQRSGLGSIDNQKRCIAARYRVTLSTGDKVRPMMKCSTSLTWGGRGMAHVILEVPAVSRGVAYMDPVSVFNTSSTANVFVPIVATTLTDGDNSNFTHIGNGELEYTGAETKIFEGYLFWAGRKQSGTGTQNYYLTGGKSTDGGSSFTEIIAERSNIMETGQTKNEGIWINYTVSLDNGDRVRPMLRVSASTTVETYTLDHLIMERNQ